METRVILWGKKVEKAKKGEKTILTKTRALPKKFGRAKNQPVNISA